MDPDADHSHTVGRRSGADPNEVALPNSTRRAAARGERSRRSGDGKPRPGNKSKSSRLHGRGSNTRTREDESVREAESVFEAESILEKREKRRGKDRASGSRRGDPSRSSGEEASDVDRSHRRGEKERKEKPRREKGKVDDRRKKPQSPQKHEDTNIDEGSESGVDIAEEKPSYAQYLVQDNGNDDIEGEVEGKDDEEVVEYEEHEPYSEEDPDDEEHDFEEDIEDANYDEHCGDTTYYTRKSSRESKKTVRRDYEDADDSDLEELRMGDGSVTAREYPQLKHDVSERGNSPELNPDLRREAVEDDELLRMARAAKDCGVDLAGGTADEGALMPASAYPRQSSDPPTAGERGRLTPQNLDPEDDDATLLSRYDAPPSPVGPERNLERNPNRLTDRAGDGASGGPGGSSYSNYMLDEEGRRQAQAMLQQTDTPGGMEEGMRDLTLRSSARGQDPPERGQGHDPKGQIGPADPPERSSARSSRGGKHSSDKYRSSRGGKQEEQSRSSRRKGRDKKEKKPPAPKGILKKRDAPIPITRFGKPVEGEGAMNSSGHSGTGDDYDEDAGDSDPEVTERKAAPKSNDHGDRGEAKDDPSVMMGKSGLRSSGMRQGKYAAINAAAAGRDSDKDDGSDDEETYSYQGHSFSESEAELGDERASEGEEDYDDDDDDDNTFKSIVSTADSRFDRSHSHFLRTADLGLTQDTIFAEQFLDEPGAKPEPHYHHPSPHPPPGVQFNIDENWVALDDGRGGHSPIAPQAVDALVAMGYRAACDPMMWTPSARTRKYMTEKGLRFDDVPIPGPLEEGEGGSADSNCLVWSGKFPHKYHGHDQPAIRSQGIVNMSPEDLVDLLMDSERVSEYNKSSIGRADEVVLSDGKDLDSCPFSGQRKKKLTGVVMSGAKIIDGTAVLDSETDDEQSDVEEIFEEVYDDHGGKSVRTISTSGSRRERRPSEFVGVTKLVRTKNKPPLVRKVLEFFTLLHCRALTDEQGGDGYIIVGRGVIPASEAEKGGKKVMHSEILLNVYIVRRLRNSRSRRSKDGKGSRGRNVSTSGRKASKSDLANRCLMICVNHLKSPMVPRMLGKKVGLSAALNFISDIRALTE